MNDHDLKFFIAGVMIVFVFALAVQMRLMAGVALKRAAKAKFDGLDETQARLAVAGAVDGEADGEAAGYLAETFPGAIRHIRLARKGTIVMAAALVGVIAAWRFMGG
ncbi:hypothetical protein WNY37_02145 [Henriciella sp. AS95]|uniref:hypothetical protein n=1 Tax=Henriciella sp. AS95 TaxID=3135782 RepID=UPI00316EB483